MPIKERFDGAAETRVGMGCAGSSPVGMESVGCSRPLLDHNKSIACWHGIPHARYSAAVYGLGPAFLTKWLIRMHDSSVYVLCSAAVLCYIIHTLRSPIHFPASCIGSSEASLYLPR